MVQWLATTGDGSADLTNVEEGNGGLDKSNNDAGEANTLPDTDTESIHKEYELKEEVIEEEENSKHDEGNHGDDNDGGDNGGGSDDDDNGDANDDYGDTNDGDY